LPLHQRRLRLANEGSIRTSISMFFDKLRDSGSKYRRDAGGPRKFFGRPEYMPFDGMFEA